MGYQSILWRLHFSSRGFDHIYELFRICQRWFQDRDHLVDLTLCDDERGQDPDDIRACIYKDQTVIHCVSDHAFNGSSADKSLHETASPSLQAEVIFCHQFIEFLLEIGSCFLNMIRDPKSLILIQDSIDRRAGERIPGRPEGAGRAR